MSLHYFIRWSNTDDEWSHLEDFVLDHAAGGQLEQLNRGDVIWPIDIRDGRLYLTGRMIAGDHVTAIEATNRLGHRPYRDDASIIMAVEDTAEPYRRINITPIACDLRFDSPSADRLTPTNEGKINTDQFRRRRRLTSQTASLLEGIWYEGGIDATDFQDLIETVEDDLAYLEGKTVTRTSQGRQRSRRLIEDAKRRFKEQHGTLFCEICGFNFGDFYGELGEDYIEAHHTEPLSAFEHQQETHVEDLVMLCANCHRMIHRGDVRSVEELRCIIANSRE